jgi:hypothetical protein
MFDAGRAQSEAVWVEFDIDLGSWDGLRVVTASPNEVSPHDDVLHLANRHKEVEFSEMNDARLTC